MTVLVSGFWKPGSDQVGTEEDDARDDQRDQQVPGEHEGDVAVVERVALDQPRGQADVGEEAGHAEDDQAEREQAELRGAQQACQRGLHGDRQHDLDGAAADAPAERPRALALQGLGIGRTHRTVIRIGPAGAGRRRHSW